MATFLPEWVATFTGASNIVYQNFFGSDFSFNKFNLDIRQFFSVFPSHIIALQFNTNIITGAVPFAMNAE